MMIEAAGVGKMNAGVFDGGVQIADLPKEIVLAAGQRDVESAAQRLLVAAEIAVRSQQRIRRLVLADAVGIKVSGPETPDIADMLVLAYDDAVRLLWHDPAAAQGMKWPGAPGISDDDLQGALRALETVSALGWKPFLHNPKLRRRLHRIKVPTLVLWGESDRVVSSEYGRAFHQAIPGSVFRVIPGAGHYPHRERPTDFVRAVTSFLLEEKG